MIPARAAPRGFSLVGPVGAASQGEFLLVSPLSCFHGKFLLKAPGLLLSGIPSGTTGEPGLIPSASRAPSPWLVQG